MRIRLRVFGVTIATVILDAWPPLGPEPDVETETDAEGECWVFEERP
jgi:hypothetical protein